MSRLVLGLDIGETSIGGALVRLNREDELEEILWMNSRVFSGVTDPRKKTPLNKQRRLFKGQRKITERRAKRRKNVEAMLVRAGLLPSDLVERNLILGKDNATLDRRYLNPYQLREKALSEKLEPYEIGRALQHVLQRRAFRSHRKAKLAELLGPQSEFKDDVELQQWIRDAQESIDLDDQESMDLEGDRIVSLAAAEDEPQSDDDASDDPRKALKMIASTELRWRKSGQPTIGAYLSCELAKNNKVRKRNRLLRQWLEEEFDAIWKTQSAHYPTIMTEEIRTELITAFQQRPLKPFRVQLPKRGWIPDNENQRKVLRMTRACALLGERKPVARRGHWIAHRFRILETLTNLRLKDGNEVRALTTEEIRRIAKRLQDGGSMTWPEVRGELGVKGKFTIETSKGSSKRLVGNTTEEILSRILRDKWDASLILDRERELAQLEFMQDIESYDCPIKLYRNLQLPKKDRPIYPLSKRQAFDLLSESFSRTTTNYSVRAMRKLIAAMLGEERLYEAKATLMANALSPGSFDRLPAPPPLRNPRVHRALCELRNVVNALIEEYEMPNVIKIELTRDIKQSKKEREKASERIKARENLNENAKKKCQERGITNPSSDDIRKYLLWERQQQTCPYCLDPIEASDLFSRSVNIDHVLPRRSGDNSFSNYVLAHEHCNIAKGDSLPFEFLGHTPKWTESIEFIKRTKDTGLLRRFQMEKVPEDYAERQLADTRYITREAAKYLKQLKVDDVWATNGRATAILRKFWGWNTLLPVLERRKETKESEKNRLDHRHHAIDALVVALSTPKRYRQALVAFRDKEQKGSIELTRDGYRPPFELVKKKINAALTSHALNLGIRGAMHDAEFFGRQEHQGKARYVKRAKIKDLLQPKGSAPDFQKTKQYIEERVYDADLRRALIDRMRQGGWVEAFKSPPLHLFDSKGNLMRTETVRISHVKRTDDSTINIDHRGGKSKKDRYAASENNHHAEIIRLANGKLTHRVVRMIDAARVMRKTKGKTKESYPGSPYGLSVKEGEILVMCLGKDELVNYDGRIYRVASIAIDGIRLRGPNDARRANDLDSVVVNGNKYSKLGRKVVASPLRIVLDTDAS